MKRWETIIVGVCLFTAIIALATQANDERLVQNSSEFTLCGKGPTHVLPPAEEAFWRLYATSNASTRFETMLARAAPAGQAYCLFALFYQDKDKYQKAIHELTIKTNKFEVYSGDYRTGYDLDLFVGLLEKETFKEVFERRRDDIGQPTNAPYSEMNRQ